MTTPHVPLPTRAEVRALVQAEHEARTRGRQQGENVHQLALDQQDRVTAYARLLEQAHGPDAAVAFLRLVAEEQTALAAHLTSAPTTLAPDPVLADPSGRIVAVVMAVVVGVVVLLALMH